MTFDVAVIGAGVVGTAIARELSLYRLDVVLVDAADDVGTGTSKANTAILHTGFDATPGTLEARLVRRGYRRLRSYAKDAGIPVELTGALLVAWTPEQLAALPAIKAKAAENGVADLVDVSIEMLYRIEPNLGPGALGGLAIPGEGIICPYTPALAFATEAVLGGVELRLSRPVIGVTRSGLHTDRTLLHTPDGDLAARFVVNAAGLGSDKIDALFGFSRFAIKPRKGELIVYDKLARGLITHVLLPVPTKTTKGVLVAPTVFGNVLLGPTAEDLDDREDKSTSEHGLAGLLDKGRAILPALLDEEVTATYAGLRAATVAPAPPSRDLDRTSTSPDLHAVSIASGFAHGDYQIHLDGKYVCVGGIRSTGLTASMGIAEYVVELLESAGLALERRRDRVQLRMPYIGSTEPRPHEDVTRIERGPDYGRIVCHCERVSLGEIRDAMTSPVPARNLDALRRRTRCLQGRCQGFYCLARVVSLIAEGTNASIEDVLGTAREDAP